MSDKRRDTPRQVPDPGEIMELIVGSEQDGRNSATVQIPARYVPALPAAICWAVVISAIRAGEGSHPLAVVFGAAAGVFTALTISAFNSKYNWVEIV